MSLSIIKGPPNSGRTELVRERFSARLVDDPILVVPSTDDIFGWARRLTREHGAFLGGKVVHFKDLVDEILDDPVSAKQIATPLQRRALAAKAIRSGWPAIASRLRDQPGLIDAALRTIDEFRENLISPEDLEKPEVADLVGPIAAVHRAYLEELATSDLTDHPARAERASVQPLTAWQGRPVFVAGFDDMTARQIELLRRLSAETEVTVAMTHEQGNRAMAVTEGLLGDLRLNGGKVERETNRPAEPPDHDPLLVNLERSFLDHSRDGTLEASDAISLIEASGRRGEAEAIGAEIAELIDSGVDPGDIAIAIDAPAVNGVVLRDVLAEYRIPSTLEAETKALQTTTGQAVLNFLKAGGDHGSAEDYFSLLRGPLGVDQSLVDQAEFAASREGTSSAQRANEIAGKLGVTVPGWSVALKEGKTSEAAISIAQLCAETLTAVDPGRLPGASTAVETQMATAICGAIAELDGVSEAATASDHIAEALLSGAIKTWAVPTTGTVRIASPYSMRAKRAGYLFIASLQERDLGATEGSPLLSLQARSALQLPDLEDQEAQETYLFYSCLAVPTKRLWLSHRVSDVHGKTEFPSPMIKEVTRLFTNDGAGLRLIKRTSSDIIFPQPEAPSAHEWALSVASEGAAKSELDDELKQALAWVEEASDVERLTRQVRDLDSPSARAGLAADRMFSASALEAFIECPYRWFFERAMRPTRFGPDPAAIARGNLIHDVLALLYRAHPGDLPTETELTSWISEMETRVEEQAAKFGLGGSEAEHLIIRRQVKSELARFLAREADRKNPTFLPSAFEQDFGTDREGSMPALDRGSWQLRGTIDRIDRDQAENGVVIDYKSGLSSYKSRAEISREGKVQLQLYLKAMEEHWGLKPAAGLYVPIFAAKKKARGLIAESQAPSLKDIGLIPRDFTDDLDQDLEAALEMAQDAAEKIMRGEIAHDPSQCLHHFEHAGVPDWIAGGNSEQAGDRP